MSFRLLTSAALLPLAAGFVSAEVFAKPPNIPNEIVIVTSGTTCGSGGAAVSWNAPAVDANHPAAIKYKIKFEVGAVSKTFDSYGNKTNFYLDGKQHRLLCEAQDFATKIIYLPKVSIRAISADASNFASAFSPGQVVPEVYGLNPIDISEAVLSTDTSLTPIVTPGDYRWSTNRKVPLGAEVYPGPLPGQVTVKWYPVAGVGGYNLYYKKNGSPQKGGATKKTVAVNETAPYYSLGYSDEAPAPAGTTLLRHVPAANDYKTGLLEFVISNLDEGDYRFAISALSDQGESDLFPRNGGLQVTLAADPDQSTGQGFMGRCSNAANCYTFAANEVPASEFFGHPTEHYKKIDYFNRNFYRMNPSRGYSLALHGTTPNDTALGTMQQLTVQTHIRQMPGTTLPSKWAVTAKPLCMPRSEDPLVYCVNTPIPYSGLSKTLHFTEKPKAGSALALPNIIHMDSSTRQNVRIDYGLFLHYGNLSLQPALSEDVTVTSDRPHAFRITEFRMPTSITGLMGKDLKVVFDWDPNNPPKLPLTVHYSLKPGVVCPANACNYLQRQFNDLPADNNRRLTYQIGQDAPLLVASGVVASFFTPEGITFDYEIRITSADGKSTPPVSAPYSIDNSAKADEKVFIVYE